MDNWEPEDTSAFIGIVCLHIAALVGQVCLYIGVAWVIILVAKKVLIG